jgi:hypothetical protein
MTKYGMRVEEGNMVKYGKDSKREESKECNVEKWLSVRSEGDMRVMRKLKNDYVWDESIKRGEEIRKENG